MVIRLEGTTEMSTPNLTLADRIWTSDKGSRLLRFVVLAIAGSLFVAGAAQITIYQEPVPITLQTLAVLSVGAAYGARLGAATLALYALEGALGLPFFAGGKAGIFDAKLDYLFPASSMGYIVGFVISAWVVGKLIESGWARDYVRTTLAALAGAAILYLPGLAWLCVWAVQTKGLDFAAASQFSFDWGLYPFIIWDTLKAILAGLAVPAVGALLRK